MYNDSTAICYEFPITPIIGSYKDPREMYIETLCKPADYLVKHLPWLKNMEIITEEKDWDDIGKSFINMYKD